MSLNEHEARRRRSIDQKQAVFMGNMRRIDSILSAFEQSSLSYDEFMRAFPPLDSAEFKALDFGATAQRLMHIAQYTRTMAAERGKVDRRGVYEDARAMISDVINGHFVQYLTPTNVDISKYVVIKRGDEVVGMDGRASCWSLVARTIDSAHQICDIGLVHSPWGVSEDSAVNQMLDDIFDEIKDNPRIVKLEIIFACGIFNYDESIKNKNTTLKQHITNIMTYINEAVAKLNKARDKQVVASHITQIEHPLLPHAKIQNTQNTIPQLSCGVVIDYYGNIYIRLGLTTNPD